MEDGHSQTSDGGCDVSEMDDGARHSQTYTGGIDESNDTRHSRTRGGGGGQGEC